MYKIDRGVSDSGCIYEADLAINRLFLLMLFLNSGTLEMDPTSVIDNVFQPQHENISWGTTHSSEIDFRSKYHLTNSRNVD